MTKVVITGGAGFVGSHVAERFLERGDEVVLFDNLSRGESLGKASAGGESYNLQYLKGKSGSLKVMQGDVRSFDALKRAAKGASVIVHLAGQVAVTASLADPRHDFEVNAGGTFNLLEAARLSDSRVIYTSTNKVYGVAVNEIRMAESPTRYRFVDRAYLKGIPESFPVGLGVHSPYGVSKLAGDLYVQDFAHSYGLTTSVFRMSCIYGERQFGVEDQGWVAWFIIAALTGRKITIYGDGKQVRDLLYVKDLVKAIEKAAGMKMAGEVFNIGGGPANTVSLLELLALIRKLPGTDVRTSFAEWRKSDQKVYISDVSKAKEALHWAPTTPISKGIGVLHRWAKANLVAIQA